MSVGTTSPIFIQRAPSPKTVKVGEGYYWVQVHSAQAAFSGQIWDKVKHLIVTSHVNLNHPNLGGGAWALQRSREVKKNEATQLGLNQNLVGIVPATMPTASISIEFMLDRENRLRDLAELINGGSFWATISLAPGTALVALTLSELAQKIIQTFIPANERVPILQFSGDFNLAGDGLREGYYIIVGSCDQNHSLPSPYENLTVRNRILLKNDLPLYDLSYVILDVYCTSARTREMNGGAAWDMKLREAEDEVQSLLNNPLAKSEQYEQGWNKCQALLREAQALIRNDPNYLRREAENIIRASYQRCEELVKQKGSDTRRGGMIKASGDWATDTSMDRIVLGIPQDDNELNAALDQYAEQVVTARHTFEAADLH